MKAYLGQKNLLDNESMNDFCLDIKNTVEHGELSSCFKKIYELMADYPHSPVPHNLLGILFELRGNHLLAMRHLRAAMALDPSYRPAILNMAEFGDSFMNKTFIYL